MGNSTARNEVKRFMSSKEGWKFLNRVRRYLTGATIRSVQFDPSDKGVIMTIHLSNEQYFEISGDTFSLETLREQFGPVFQRMAIAGKE